MRVSPDFIAWAEAQPAGVTVKTIRERFHHISRATAYRWHKRWREIVIAAARGQSAPAPTTSPRKP